ncbi:MAG: helix-turn-helix domain-containing protein, partial [Pseudomonadota bacterium]
MALTTDHLLQQVARLEALNANLTFRISRMAKLLEAEGAQRLEGSGLNLTSYRMMMVIAIFEEISVSDLSKLMLIDRAQISRAASDLIEDGL